MNKVIISGRLVKDVEMSRTVANVAIGKFCIAINEYAGKSTVDGKNEYYCSFINCSVFKTKAEVIEKYFKKGDYILIVGRLKQTRYKNKDGNEVNYVEVIVEDFDFTPKVKDNTQETKMPQAQKQEQVENVDLDGDLTAEDLPF